MLERNTLSVDNGYFVQPLQDTVRKLELIASQLKEHASIKPDVDVASASADPNGSPEGQLARYIVRQRRMRPQLLGVSMFGEPAWDMLLDLFAAHEENAPVSISSLCIAAAVPNSTACRWITSMTAQGILVRDGDPDDGRRTWISLAPDMVDRMRRLLHSYQRARPVRL